MLQHTHLYTASTIWWLTRNVYGKKLRRFNWWLAFIIVKWSLYFFYSISSIFSYCWYYKISTIYRVYSFVNVYVTRKITYIQKVVTKEDIFEIVSINLFFFCSCENYLLLYLLVMSLTAALKVSICTCPVLVCTSHRALYLSLWFCYYTSLMYCMCVWYVYTACSFNNVLHAPNW